MDGNDFVLREFGFQVNDERIGRYGNDPGHPRLRGNHVSFSCTRYGGREQKPGHGLHVDGIGVNLVGRREESMSSDIKVANKKVLDCFGNCKLVLTLLQIVHALLRNFELTICLEAVWVTFEAEFPHGLEVGSREVDLVGENRAHWDLLLAKLVDEIGDGEHSCIENYLVKHHAGLEPSDGGIELGQKCKVLLVEGLHAELFFGVGLRAKQRKLIGIVNDEHFAKGFHLILLGPKHANGAIDDKLAAGTGNVGLCP